MPPLFVRHITDYYVAIIGRTFGRMKALGPYGLALIFCLQHILNPFR